MSGLALRAEGLGKRYRMGVLGAPYGRLSESLSNAARSLVRGRANGDGPKGFIWALRDVSFEVGHGEVVGIIGRNGAGKTTLLKVLSRITEPTEGRVGINGRVGSLLEVGTGFHPELTGRENIFLNGAILGMGRREIQQKFDEIVEFAETGAFLDTPVKRYSSGMYVRLAFAVAAHLEPEVLIIDEVLAVGDAAFQKKSLGKMNDAARSGRTVLFVSHNMAAVENLCHRAIVLTDGSIGFEGATGDAVSHYLRMVDEALAMPIGERTDRRGVGGVRVTSLEVRRADDGSPANVVASGDDIEIALAYELEPGFTAREPVVGIAFHSELGSIVTSVHNNLTGDVFPALGERGTFVCTLPRLALAPATYRVDFSVRRSVGDWNYLDSLEGAAHLTVVEGDFYTTGASPPPSTGFALTDASWRLEDA